MPWPATLEVAMTPYQVTEEPPVIRTQFEQGPDRVTRRATQYTSIINAQVHIEGNTMLDTWRDFWEGEAALGSAWFDMDIPTSQNVATHRVRIMDARLEAFSQRDASDDLWTLSLVLETDEHIRV